MSLNLHLSVGSGPRKQRARIDPRLQGEALAGRMRAVDYQDYLHYKERATVHKQDVEHFLSAHPTATWGLS